ncbi:hypothetical protein QFC21_005591 [Naganishia friedmannii]|uniref:Uncharacterized protein n=1 Tax=Naganishia friedmannii TaxID=89922 RepID=A0ACC2V977_9TREE|nr:hypothetical protein QFC21_005591 [Naganishia friedmannii]
MLSLEITGTKLADRFDKPSLQRQLDPLIRFKGKLNADRGNTAGLYVMSSKAGSFTPWHVDATGEVHWLIVVTGVKWVFTLPPTKSNIDVWRKAEHGSVRADFLWLPDLCADSPVTKQVVTSGQSILFPSGCLHAVASGPKEEEKRAELMNSAFSTPSRIRWHYRGHGHDVSTDRNGFTSAQGQSVSPVRAGVLAPGIEMRLQMVGH